MKLLQGREEPAMPSRDAKDLGLSSTPATRDLSPWGCVCLIRCAVNPCSAPAEGHGQGEKVTTDAVGSILSTYSNKSSCALRLPRLPQTWEFNFVQCTHFAKC